ncbi:bacillithiol biosynthesis cysteine-adding enzyme BshC [candidate division KSB1 bacterium]|nr:bacillithiol biosynthesis cysteine-adding enzyme BshC [candidate division KSB1 bacterium]
MIDTIAFEQLPGFDKLFLDYITRYDRVREFYPGDPASPDSFADIARKRADTPYEAGELAEVLYDQNERYGQGDATRHNIDALARGDALVVVTGQQAGLFSGPMYTILKIITTIKLAAQLSASLKQQVLPVFWIASDDHDFNEINHVYLVDKENRLARFEYGDDTSPPRIPIFSRVFGESIAPLIADISERTHPSEWKPDLIHTLETIYAPGENWILATGKFLMWLFKTHGLIIVDPSDARLKKLGASLFETEIRHPEKSSALVREMSQQLTEQGYAPKIQLNKSCLNLFYIDQQRKTIFLKDEEFEIQPGDAVTSRESLLTILKQTPERFSPNVVLRPLYQDAIFPTIAYVAGPNELAYFAQLMPVYKFFGVQQPLLFPRNSSTVIDKKAERILTRNRIQLTDIYSGMDSLFRQLVAQNMPPNLQQRLLDLSDNLDSQFRQLKAEAEQIDPTLGAFIQNNHNRIQGQIKAIEKKLLQSMKQKNSLLEQQLTYLYSAIFPDGGLQERRLNILTYLFKFNTDFITLLHEQMNINRFQHTLIYL